MECFAEFICSVNWIGKCCGDGPTPSAGFWASGVWGGPSGTSVWAFDAWGE